MALPRALRSLPTASGGVGGHRPREAHPLILPLVPDSCPRRSLGQTEGPFFFLPFRLSPVGRGWLRRGPWWPGMVTARVSEVQECSWARGRECEAEAYGPEVLPSRSQAVGRRGGQKPTGGGEGPRAQSLWGFTHL